MGETMTDTYIEKLWRERNRALEEALRRIKQLILHPRQGDLAEVLQICDELLSQSVSTPETKS